MNLLIRFIIIISSFLSIYFYYSILLIYLLEMACMNVWHPYLIRRPAQVLLPVIVDCRLAAPVYTGYTEPVGGRGGAEHR